MATIVSMSGQKMGTDRQYDYFARPGSLGSRWRRQVWTIWTLSGGGALVLVLRVQQVSHRTRV